MEIAGYQQVTLKDYPGMVAAVCFTQKCQLRCPYCQNPDLVLPERFGSGQAIRQSTQDFFTYLNARKEILDGLVVSGGEPLLQSDVLQVLKSFKAKGLAIKLDTNGMQPDNLEEVIQHRLVDYVALDYKNCMDSWGITVGITDPNTASVSYHRWLDSLVLLEKSGIEYELRTTIVRELHSYAQLQQMAGELERVALKSTVPWYWQTFSHHAPVLSDYLTPPSPRRELTPYSLRELAAYGEQLKDITARISLRL